MLEGRKVVLRPKRAEDARQDYEWRLDPELAELDATLPLDEKFEEYRTGFVWELEHMSRHRRRFAIETLQGRHIGNVAYFDIEVKRKEAQIGIMVGDRDYWGKGYGTAALMLGLEKAFNEEGLETVFLRTLEWNLRAQGSFRKCGFVPFGKLKDGRYDFVLMKVTRDQWLKAVEQQLKAVPENA